MAGAAQRPPQGCPPQSTRCHQRPLSSTRQVNSRGRFPFHPWMHWPSPSRHSPPQPPAQCRQCLAGLTSGMCRSTGSRAPPARAWRLRPIIGAAPRAPGGPADGGQAGLRIASVCEDLVSKRRADPDDSLLSALIAAEEDGDRLTHTELVSTALLLLVAGFETTVNLIGNGTVALLTAPDGRQQWDRLRRDPALVPGAVEELLRYDSPVQMTSRNATEDVELGGTMIKQGTPVIVAIGGANRDPAVFDQPGRLLTDRPNAARHLSFSLGIHHCLGAALARLEGRIAVEELTRRYPALALAGTPVRRPLLVLRGFESVPVRAA